MYGLIKNVVMMINSKPEIVHTLYESVNIIVCRKTHIDSHILIVALWEIQKMEILPPAVRFCLFLSLQQGNNLVVQLLPSII